MTSPFCKDEAEEEAAAVVARLPVSEGSKKLTTPRTAAAVRADRSRSLSRLTGIDVLESASMRTKLAVPACCFVPTSLSCCTTFIALSIGWATWTRDWVRVAEASA